MYNTTASLLRNHMSSIYVILNILVKIFLNFYLNNFFYFYQIMDAFGDNFVNEPEVDPAAEFLAREQDQLAGLEDEITPMAVTLAAAAAAGQSDGK